jgi:hypothetical protein
VSDDDVPDAAAAVQQHVHELCDGSAKLRRVRQRVPDEQTELCLGDVPAMTRVLVACLLVPALAWADDPAPPSEPAPAPAPAPEPAQPPAPADEQTPSVTEPVPPPTIDELDADLERLDNKMRKLERAQAADDATRQKVTEMSWLSRYITVFVDVGAFAVGGDGSGIRPDLGHVYFPKYYGRVAGQWVFMGDPLSTAINSNGEPSDTSTSREIETDTINSGGRPSVVVNTVGLSISKAIKDGVSLSALAELLPRPDHNILDIELASVDYRPSPELDLLLSAGKVDSVLGVEYRHQDAYRRIGITPSLICRYTCGRPLGVRARLTKGRLSTSATITNGDNFQRIFEPDRELKSNLAPTASGHVQWMLFGEGGVAADTVGKPSLEVGVSGAFGPQDDQPAMDLLQWHVGFDARLRDLHDFDAVAEYVQGKQPGKTESMTECDAAPCLTYKGAYLFVDRRVTTWLTPYARVDWRSAVHINGTQFVYESHTLRATVGGQFELTSRIVGKLEYTYNRELGGIPQFPDDVLTTSIVVATD